VKLIASSVHSAVKSRADQLKLDMTDEQVKDATAKIKELADTRTQSMDDVDRILRIYHQAVNNGELKVGDQEVLQELLDKVGTRATGWSTRSMVVDCSLRSHSICPKPSKREGIGYGLHQTNRNP
jgi:hypothetical protein